MLFLEHKSETKAKQDTTRKARRAGGKRSLLRGDRNKVEDKNRKKTLCDGRLPNAHWMFKLVGGVQAKTCNKD